MYYVSGSKLDEISSWVLVRDRVLRSQKYLNLQGKIVNDANKSFNSGLSIRPFAFDLGLHTAHTICPLFFV